MLQADIASRIDAGIAGSQEVVGPDSRRFVVIDARCVQAHILDIRCPAATGKDGVDGHCARVVVADEIDELIAALQAYAHGLGVQPNFNAIVCEGIGQDLRSVALFLGQEQRLIL